MVSAISTSAAALVYGYNALGYVSDARNDEIEYDELPHGRIDQSMTDQINSALSAALAKKEITVTGLKPRGDSDKIVARGKVGSFATITLSPELLKGENTKATEWRIARAIGSIQSDNLLPALKKFGALAITAGVGHLLFGAYCWSFAIALAATALNTCVASPLVFDRNSDAETLKFANSVATKEQLAGGISYLQEQAKASEEAHVARQEKLASYHPYLKEGYTKAYKLFQQYVPGVEAELAETQKAFDQRAKKTQPAPQPAPKPDTGLPKVEVKETPVVEQAVVTAA